MVSAMKANIAIGRLNVNDKFGDFNGYGKLDSVFSYGARSFTVLKGTTGSLV